MVISGHNIVDISIGNDHVVALSNDGTVFTWGNTEHSRLGRSFRKCKIGCQFVPGAVTLPAQVKHVATGAYHSFAITKDGRVWAWGLNQFAQCGIFDRETADACLSESKPYTIDVPTVVEHLTGLDIVHIAAGLHYSAALTADGHLLMWGRLDSHQLGMDTTTLPPDDVMNGDRGPLYLTRPQIVTQTRFSHIACGINHNIAIDLYGNAWSWGDGSNSETGHGVVADVEIPTMIENMATKGVKMLFAGSGGHFSVLAGKQAPIHGDPVSDV